MMKKNNISIYIHIPFCKSRCLYCDFCSSLIDIEQVKKYISYLKREISLYNNLLENREISTIFIGGGTPSSIPYTYIGEILSALKKYKLSPETEISIEANPNSLNLEKLEAYKAFGINRLSLGAQSFNEKILKVLGRIHNKKDIFIAVENIKNSGINNFNLDMMLGLPYQKLKDIYESIKILEILNPTHISYYSLIIEDKTRIKNLYEKNPEIFPSEDEDREMYHFVVNKLNSLGYLQYEISNFAKKGLECKHNLSYWKLEDYLGIGLSASSNLALKRFTNSYSFAEYYNSIDKNKFPYVFSETLTKKDRINEYAIMGIRLNKGINFKDFEKRFGINFYSYYEKEIEKHLNSSLLEMDKSSIYLTEKGRDLSNLVEIDLIK